MNNLTKQILITFILVNITGCAATTPTTTSRTVTTTTTVQPTLHQYEQSTMPTGGAVAAEAAHRF